MDPTPASSPSSRSSPVRERAVVTYAPSSCQPRQVDDTDVGDATNEAAIPASTLGPMPVSLSSQAQPYFASGTPIAGLGSKGSLQAKRPCHESSRSDLPDGDPDQRDADATYSRKWTSGEHQRGGSQLSLRTVEKIAASLKKKTGKGRVKPYERTLF